MQVVIAGGSGLIGRALVDALTAGSEAGGGNDVVVLSRDPQRVGALPPGARAVRWDGRTPAGWEPLLAAGAAVVNLAGEPVAEGRWTAERKRRIRASRVDAGQAMTAALRAAVAAGRAPAVLVQASAVGYYGGAGGDAVLTEEAPAGDDFLGGVTAEWEASTAAAEVLGVRRVVLRTGIVLAREGGALAKMLPTFKLGAGGPLGGGGQWLPWIHLADQVGAMLFLLRSAAARGTYNLCAPNPVTNRDFVHALGRALHRPSVLPVPAAGLRLLFGEMADALLGGQRALPARLLAAGYRFRFPDLAPALADLLPRQ